jgi:hypothetical protein
MSSSSICRIVRDSKTKAATGYDFDAKKLTVTEPRKLSKGKFSNVRYNGGALYFETPYLHAPTSVSSFEDADKKTLFLSMRGHDEKPEVKMFLDAMMGAQERIIDQASDLKLLGDKYTRDMTSGLMSPLVKTSDNGYPPAFRITLPSREGKDTFDAFKATAKGPEECSLDDLDVRGSRIRAIFAITSVWVVNKTWGVSAKATQILIKPNFDVPMAGVSNFSDDAIGSDDNDDDEPRADRACSDEDA